MIALYGRKIGMTQIFDELGASVPVTVLKIEPSVVIAAREKEKNGYDAKVLGVFDIKQNKVIKPKAGQFKDDIDPRKKLYEVRGFEDVAVGTKLGIEVFEDASFVDVTGTSKGKGHQGVMRRHGASGGPGGHGSKFHRTAGSTGQAATPSRVMKGTKMSGRMGSDKVTVQNLKIVKVDIEQGLIAVRGAVPGVVGSEVLVRKAIKKGI